MGVQRLMRRNQPAANGHPLVLKSQPTFSLIPLRLVHKDANNALNCLVAGEKEWIFVDPTHITTGNVPMVWEPDDEIGGYSSVNVDAIDVRQHPEFCISSCLCAVGLPAPYHYARCRDVSRTPCSRIG